MDGDGIFDTIENCLLCYTKCDDWIILNSKHGLELQIKEIISKHFWFEVKFINTNYTKFNLFTILLNFSFQILNLQK